MNVPLGETVWKRCTHIIPYLDKYFILLVSTASFSLQEFSTAFSEQINIFAFQQVWMTRCIHSFRSITSQPLDSLEKTRITKNKTALTPWLLSWCWNIQVFFLAVSVMSEHVFCPCQQLINTCYLRKIHALQIYVLIVSPSLFFLPTVYSEWRISPHSPSHTHYFRHARGQQ